MPANLKKFVNPKFIRTVDLALIRTRREVDRELAERKEAIRHSYQICYNRYGNAVSMPIIVLKKGTYRITSIKPIYTIQKGRTISFVQAMKNLVGDRMALWGGIDTHEVLPHGSIEDVAKEVEKKAAIYGKGGGYILSADHNILVDIPAKNVVAMFE